MNTRLHLFGGRFVRWGAGFKMLRGVGNSTVLGRGLNMVVKTGMVAALTGCGPKLTPEQAQAAAAEVWVQRCVNCHGEQGAGDGSAAVSFPTRPRALNEPAWQAQTSDDRILAVIIDGGQPHGLSPLMAANPDLRTKPEVAQALVRLVRGLAQPADASP